MSNEFVHGVDVYEGDGQITWPKVAKHSHFAIIKISEGDLIDSLATPERVQRAREAGLIVGGYCFLRPKPGRTGAQEVQIFLKHCRKIGLYDDSRRPTIRPVLDFEASAFDTNTRIGRYRTRLYLRQAIGEIRKQLGGRHPLVYTGAWFADDTVKLGWNLGCPLWVASYTDHPIIPTAWNRRQTFIWQFTDKALVDGIAKPCDLNTYIGPDGVKGFRRHLVI